MGFEGYGGEKLDADFFTGPRVGGFDGGDGDLEGGKVIIGRGESGIGVDDGGGGDGEFIS